MNKFLGKVSNKPERRDGQWYFSIWNTKSNEGINCISSKQFEVENKDLPFDIKPLDAVEVFGKVQMPGTCFFDSVNVLSGAEG